MERQLDFFPATTFAPVRNARAPEHRYYFTLVPPPEMARKIERDATWLGLRHGVRAVVRAERLHVSLHPVGRGKEIAPDLLEKVLVAGEAIRQPRFDLTFDMVRTFGARRPPAGGQYPVVLTCSDGAAEARALYADLRMQMQRLGLPPGPRVMEPHLTIWYGAASLPDLRLRRPFRWPVRSFWLVHTLPGMRRPDYLAEWALKP